MKLNLTRTQILGLSACIVASVALSTTTPAAGAALTGGKASLSGVVCHSSSECWAVGSRTGIDSDSRVNFVLRRQGGTWSTVPVPNPGGVKPGHFNELAAVTCVSAARCWAVGQDGAPNHVKNQILRWNGSMWEKVAVPQPVVHSQGGTTDQLNAIACVSWSDCWAVGQTREDLDSIHNEALHWNGRKWSVAPTPNPGGLHGGDDMLAYNNLTGVWCLSAGNCWAVGVDAKNVNQPHFRNQALHWGGAKWTSTTLSSQKGKLEAVACSSSKACLAVGVSSKRNKSLQWDGAKWSSVSVPNPGSGPNALRGVACTSVSDCWAVGKAGSSLEILHRSGMAWTRSPSPITQGSLSAVTCRSSGNCWAVGSGPAVPTGVSPVILHWNGTRWLASNFV